MTDKLLTTYARRHQVPKRDGLKTSVCPKCMKWFARPPKFRNCHGCMRTAADRARLSDVILRLTAPSNSKGMGAPGSSHKARGQKAPLGLALSRNLAMVEALRRDCPNVRQADLKPQWQEFWL